MGIGYVFESIRVLSVVYVYELIRISGRSRFLFRGIPLYVCEVKGILTMCMK